MKRDMELIRELLLRLESLPVRRDGGANLLPDEDEALQIEGYTPDQVAYHIALLFEAKYVWSSSEQPMRLLNGNWVFSRLTWSGHEFIDAIRDPEVWKQTKGAAAKAGGWTVGLIKDLGMAYLKHVIKERTGLDLSGS